MLSVKIDVRDLARTREVYEKASRETPKILSRTINWVGARARTKAQRELVKTTSAKYGTVADAIRTRNAGPDHLVFEMIASGRAIPLSEFDPRQTRRGVSTKVWGRRRVLPHTFVIARMGDNVFVRTSASRFPIRKLWGPALPKELVSGPATKAFKEAVRENRDKRIGHELERLIRKG